MNGITEYLVDRLPSLVIIALLFITASVVTFTGKRE